MRRVFRGAAAAAVAVALLCSGCSGGDTVEVARGERVLPASPTGPPVGPQYVALGDSYAAAPGVPDTNGAGGCFRSSGNYATLVAEQTGLTITDVTCSGATSESLLRDQVPRITPQAELVTVGIGGNDFDLFTNLITNCVDVAAGDPDGSPCDDAARDGIEKTLTRIATNVDGVLAAIAEAAPSAQVVVVGYPDLLPATGSCPDRVPLATGDYALVNDVIHGLSDALSTAAAERGYDFVDLRGPSQGHDICSAEPWINGQTVAPDGTIPFHPFAVEQEAVARIIATFL